MVEFEPAIKSLTAKEVDFVIIGGVAISVHSTGYVIRDLDFCYLRTAENLKRIVSASARFSRRFAFHLGRKNFTKWNELYA